MLLKTETVTNQQSYKHRVPNTTACWLSLEHWS